MERILDIERYGWHSDIIKFAGTLRNQRKFQLFQKVFIKANNKLYQCEVVGIELPPRDNVDYIYKIELPKELIQDETQRVSYICKHIFESVEQAKSEAIRQADLDYKLSLDCIDRFFKPYIDVQE